MKINHIGIAVKSLSESVPLFEKIFGTKATPEEFVEKQKVKVRKIHLENIEIELLEGTDIDSPITKFIEKRGEGIHHCSFEVENIADELNQLKEKGIKLINEQPQIGSDNMLIAFLHPKSTAGVLIELSQKQ